MFDSISKILEKFTTGQRVIVLLFLLLSIVLISLGPSFIDTNDCKEPIKQIEEQRKQLLRLNSEIIEVQTRCTNERLTREKEIGGLLSTLESEVKRIESQTRDFSRNMIVEDYVVTGDPTDTSQMILYAPSPRVIIPNPPDFSKIKGTLHEMHEMVDPKQN